MTVAVILTKSFVERIGGERGYLGLGKEIRGVYDLR